MTYCIFKEQICKAVEGLLREQQPDISVETESFVRNNGVIKDTMVFRKANLKEAPAVCLEDVYREYQKGKCLEELAVSGLCAGRTADHIPAHQPGEEPGITGRSSVSPVSGSCRCFLLSDRRKISWKRNDPDTPGALAPVGRRCGSAVGGRISEYAGALRRGDACHG